MRRILRALVRGDADVGSTITLMNPECVEDLKKMVQHHG